LANKKDNSKKSNNSGAVNKIEKFTVCETCGSVMPYKEYFDYMSWDAIECRPCKVDKRSKLCGFEENQSKKEDKKKKKKNKKKNKHGISKDVEVEWMQKM
jgi:GTP-sensing pleiotropic transcriptional regulator CodY